MLKCGGCMSEGKIIDWNEITRYNIMYGKNL